MSVSRRRMAGKRRYLTETDLIELMALCSILPGSMNTQTLASIGYRIGGPKLALLTVFGAAATFFIRTPWIFPVVLSIGGAVSVHPPWGYRVAFAAAALGGIIAGGLIAIAAVTLTLAGRLSAENLIVTALSAVLLAFTKAPEPLIVDGALTAGFHSPEVRIPARSGFEVCLQQLSQ